MGRSREEWPSFPRRPALNPPPLARAINSHAGSLQLCSATFSLPAGSWTYLAATVLSYWYKTDVMLYANGLPVGSLVEIPGAHSLAGTAARRAVIGRGLNTANASLAWGGGVAEVAVYDRALPAANVSVSRRARPFSSLRALCAASSPEPRPSTRHCPHPLTKTQPLAHANNPGPLFG